MAYAPVETREGVQPIALAANNQNHPLGTIVRAYDASYGEGEFIYLPGVSGTVTGSVVTWGGVSGSGAAAKPTWQTALAPATANLGQPLAVAMAANRSRPVRLVPDRRHGRCCRERNVCCGGQSVSGRQWPTDHHSGQRTTGGWGGHCDQ